MIFFRHYKEELDSIMKTEQMKELSKYREYVANEEIQTLNKLFEKEKQKAAEMAMKLEKAELANIKVSEKLRELETAGKAEKQKAKKAAADKHRAESKLKISEARHAEIEKEKKELKEIAEQEKRKAAEAAEKERGAATKVRHQEINRITAKSRLEEIENRYSKLKEEKVLLEQRLRTGNHTFLESDLRSIWQLTLYLIAYFFLLLLLLFELFKCLF